MALLKSVIGTTSAVLVSTVVAYDDGIKPCWNIRLMDTESFCYEPVQYPMSTPVYYQAEQRDNAARTKYMELKKKWDDGGKGSPSNHCLAIARDFYCFTEFPRCDNDDK